MEPFIFSFLFWVHASSTCVVVVEGVGDLLPCWVQAERTLRAHGTVPSGVSSDYIAGVWHPLTTIILLFSYVCQVSKLSLHGAWSWGLSFYILRSFL